MAVAMFTQAADRLEPPPAPARRWATPGLMAADLEASTVQTPALDLIDQHLVDVADRTCDRLMLFMPVQEGKSERVSRRFPAWLLAHDPTLRIGIVSYQSEKATRWGRAIRRDAQTHPALQIRLRSDDRAAGRWHTWEGGGVYCAGIGGALSGEPLDVLIVDDPIGSREQAESTTYRDAAWDWWENVGERRLSSRGVVVLMTTRWHADDLAGRILARPGREAWTVLSIPAIAEADDPLGRAPGVELESVQRRKPGHFTGLAKRLSAYVFASIYQQRPVLAEGNLFKRGDWRFWQPTEPGKVRVGGQAWQLNDCRKFATIDLASSVRTRADFTVAAVWAITPNGDLLCLDRVRDRVAEQGHFDLVTPLRERWLGPYDVTHVESRMFGTTFVYAAGRAGIPMAELKADVDKVTRATAAADLVRQHRVWLPSDAPWLDEWLDEHAEFPSAAFDDQVDVMAYAARVAITSWVDPAAPAPRPRRLTGEVDLMSVPM